MKENKCVNSRLLNAKEVCEYLNLGRNRGVEFAKSIGAERKIGRRCLYDKVVIDRYFDKQAQEVR
ncbi:polyprenyl synthetase solanesyl diphosphate synthase [Coprococcus catus]